MIVVEADEWKMRYRVVRKVHFARMRDFRKAEREWAKDRQRLLALRAELDKAKRLCGGCFICLEAAKMRIGGIDDGATT